MLKRKPHSKRTEKGLTTPPVNPENSVPNERRPGSFVVDEKMHTGEEPGRPQDQALRERRTGQYQHKSVPPGHGNNPDLLKYYLAQNYASPANLAREANVSRAAVSAVIHGRTRSERIERLISKSCGRTLQELFPAWYSENK